MAPIKKAKKIVDYDDMLHISNEMAGVDSKDRTYYDRLTDEQKKKFSTFLMLKWGPSVQGSADLQGYYLMAFNQHVNKDFWNLNKHPKLQWLSMTAASPGMGKQKHYWVTASSRTKISVLEKKLCELYPDTKLDDIRTILKVNSIEDILECLKQYGMTDKDLQNLL